MPHGKLHKIERESRYRYVACLLDIILFLHCKNLRERRLESDKTAPLVNNVNADGNVFPRHKKIHYVISFEERTNDGDNKYP